MAYELLNAPIMGSRRRKREDELGFELPGEDELAPIASSEPDGTRVTVPPPGTSSVPYGRNLAPPIIEPPSAVPAFEPVFPLTPEDGGRVAPMPVDWPVTPPEPVFGPTLPLTPAVPLAQPMDEPFAPGPTEPFAPPPIEPPPPRPPEDQGVVVTTPDTIVEEPSPIPREGGGVVVTPPETIIEEPSPVTPRRLLPEQLGLEGVETRPITGNEAPERILPRRSEAVSELLQRLQAEALRQLEQPSPYDDELFRQALETERQRLDEYYGGLQRQLEAELARRGLSYGSTAGQMLADLATQRGRAFQEVLTPLLRERAQALGSARRSAAETARDLLGFRTALEAAERGELRGERSYLDALREAAYEQALRQMQLEEAARAQQEAEFQRLLAQALATSDPTALLAALGQAGTGLGDVAAAYGQRAEASGRQLGSLAELLAMILAQRGGARSAPPAVGTITNQGVV